MRADCARAARRSRSIAFSLYVQPPPSVRSFGRGSKRPGLRFGGVPFVMTVRAIPRGGLEQAGRQSSTIQGQLIPRRKLHSRLQGNR